MGPGRMDKTMRTASHCTYCCESGSESEAGRLLDISKMVWNDDSIIIYFGTIRVLYTL